MSAVSEITIELLNQYLSGEYKHIENIDLTALKKFTDFHNITPIISLILEQDKSLKKEDIKPFVDLKMQTVILFAKQQYLLGQITKAFNKAEIDHIVLKGSTIGKYYPEEWQRTGCDIDVLVRQKDFKKARELFITELNLKQQGSTGHDVEFESENNVNVELHFDSEENIIREADLWHEAEREENNLFSLSNEMLLAYAVAHTAKHFKTAGCGIRAVLDLYFLKKNMPFKKEKTEEILSKCNLLKFYECFSHLTDVWFGKEPATALTNSMAEYIFASGTYGTMANYYTHSVPNKEKAAAFFLKRAESIGKGYKAQNKSILLLPFFVLKSAFGVVFRKGGLFRYKAKNKAKDINRLNKANAELFKELKIEEL